MNRKICRAAKGRSVVVDMNAAIRAKAIGTQTIERVARYVIKTAIGVDAGTVFTVFDKPHRMPTIRSDLHRRRYGSIVMASANQTTFLHAAERHAVQHTPAQEMITDTVSFKELFAPGDSKQVAWSVFGAAVWRAGVKAVAEKKLVAFQSHFTNGATSIAGNPGQPATYHNICESLGEADLATFEVARHEYNKVDVEIQSVDTDLILQTIASGIQLSVKNRQFWITLKGETYCAATLCKMYGARDPNARLTAAFWLIMAGGTDYSKPASDNGFSKACLMALATTSKPCFTVTGDTVWISVDAVQHALSTIKRRKLQSQPINKPERRSLQRCIWEAARAACYYGMYSRSGDIADFAMSPGPQKIV